MKFKDGYNLVDWSVSLPPPNKTHDEPKKSNLPCPMVISDSMPDTEHVNGNFYSSKSAYRAVTKANGYVEVGNDPSRFRKPGQKKPDPKARRAAADKAIQQVLGH